MQQLVEVQKMITPAFHFLYDPHHLHCDLLGVKLEETDPLSLQIGELLVLTTNSTSLTHL